MARHDTPSHLRAVLFYGVASLLVLAVGSVAIWSFLERQSLRRTLAPEPLPPVTVVTADPDSELAAAWVDLLTKAQFSATLVPARKYRPADGVLALADAGPLTPALAAGVRRQLAAGGGVAILGAPPENAASLLGLTATAGTSGPAFRLAEIASPVLARVKPGAVLRTALHPVALLEETPTMTVDARWEESSRAAVAHFRHGGGRVLFLGFSPAALWNADDADLALMLRTAFRWVASQPVSEGAAGMPAASRTLTTAARLRARDAMSWSFDRIEGDEGAFVLRLRNDGKENLENPTVKIWLPESVERVAISGALFGRRSVALIAAEEERAAIVSLPGLRAHEDRLIRIDAR